MAMMLDIYAVKLIFEEKNTQECMFQFIKINILIRNLNGEVSGEIKLSKMWSKWCELSTSEINNKDFKLYESGAQE